MNLYFIKGTSRSDWRAMKFTLKQNANPAKVIADTERDGWRCVTITEFNAWRKKNSQPDSGRSRVQPALL